MNPKAQNSNSAKEGLVGIGIMLLAIGSICACLLMVLLFAVGFWLIGHALWTSGLEIFSGKTGNADSGVVSSKLALVEGLHGLEFFFFAPLPYLVFISLARYFRSSRTATNIDGDGNLHEAHSANHLHRVKTLVVSLMTASVATDLLSRAMQGISLQTAAAEALVMLMLGAYWFALEKTCHHSRMGYAASAKDVSGPHAGE